MDDCGASQPAESLGDAALSGPTAIPRFFWNKTVRLSCAPPMKASPCELVQHASGAELRADTVSVQTTSLVSALNHSSLIGQICCFGISDARRNLGVEAQKRNRARPPPSASLISNNPVLSGAVFRLYSSAHSRRAGSRCATNNVRPNYPSSCAPPNRFCEVW